MTALQYLTQGTIGDMAVRCLLIALATVITYGLGYNAGIAYCRKALRETCAKIAELTRSIEQ